MPAVCINGSVVVERKRAMTKLFVSRPFCSLLLAGLFMLASACKPQAAPPEIQPVSRHTDLPASAESQISPSTGISLEPTDAATPSLQPTPTAEPTPAPTETELAVIHSPTPTETPEPSPTPTPEVVFQDTFSVSYGWYIFEGERYRMSYRDNGYYIFNNMLQAAVNSVRTQNYDDVHLEVDASRVSGPPNGYYGLVCRFQDDSNYYALVIGSDGYYGIARLLGGRIEFISRPPSPNEAVKGLFNVNRVGASCIGNKLTLYANGVKLTEATDDTFTSGFIGLVVGTTSVEGIEVRFDNFSVSRWGQ
jgi:hypothetical protein